MPDQGARANVFETLRGRADSVSARVLQNGLESVSFRGGRPRPRALRP